MLDYLGTRHSRKNEWRQKQQEAMDRRKTVPIGID
jgi:hypothetical protein